MTPTKEPEIDATAGKNAEPRRLLFLDGMRGVAAIYVVCSHLIPAAGARLPDDLRFLTNWANFGHYGVGVFIVLSGFVLMMPVAATTSVTMPGGWLSYFKRRARRLLPPYYAALALCVAFSVFGQHGGGFITLINHIRDGALVPFIVLVNNLIAPPAGFQSSSILWSVATEWQIYILFPVLLLPTLRVAGPLGMVIAGFAVGCFPLTFQNHFGAYPGLFALGCIAALTVGGHGRYAALRVRVPWGTLASAMIAIWLAVCFAGGQKWYVMDPLLGLTTAVCIIWLAGHSHSGHAGKPDLIRQVLEARPVLLLGTISYSLYITHMILGVKALWFLKTHTFQGLAPLAITWVAVIPAIIMFAIVFHIIFERPFLPAHYRQLQRELLTSTPKAA